MKPRPQADAAHEEVSVARGGLRRRRGMWALLAGVAAVIAFGVMGLARTPNRPTGQAVIEEAIMLRCLSPAEGADLILPILGDNGTAVHSPRAPRVLTVRATAERLRQVKATLDRHDGAGSAACVSQPSKGTG